MRRPFWFTLLLGLTSLPVAGGVPASTSPVALSFPQAVSRLQDLDYLPVTRAFIRGPNGTRIRHDAFLWPVPKPLQHAADRYAWNSENPFIRGAVIQFERENGILGPGGTSEGRLHRNVLAALARPDARKNAYAYEWVYVTKGRHTRQPEQLHIWEAGTHFARGSFGNTDKGFVTHNSWIEGIRVNTGVLGSTPDGTWPIYQRLPVTTMRGAFPVPVSSGEYQALAGKQVPQWGGASQTMPARGFVNGSPVRWQPYDDPGIRWVNYFDDGRGIHYYPRAAYGFPQSAGCVEEPFSGARAVYRILHYGVPVTVAAARFQGSSSKSRYMKQDHY